ncbi:MAG: pcaR1 [Frankiales bacterium]|jgi:IclR family pca regulon transcriptional regulator|nr:pcaR1 [Frankiales bacterium]
MGAERGPHFVQSLERGLAVIKAFSSERPQLSLSDVARESGLTRAAARRFLLTLVDLNYARTDGRLFSLTPRVLELGYVYLASQTLPEVAAPHLERLVSQVQESSSVSVLDGTDVVYVARIPKARIMTVAINVGTRFPAHATSMGRVLLGGLEAQQLDRYFAEAVLRPHTARTVTDEKVLRVELARVARQGWAILDQELEEGLRSVAVPIHDRDGQVIAAANISVHASRTPLAAIRKQLLPPLLEAAAGIEADLRIAGPAQPARPRPDDAQKAAGRPASAASS